MYQYHYDYIDTVVGHWSYLENVCGLAIAVRFADRYVHTALLVKSSVLDFSMEMLN